MRLGSGNPRKLEHLKILVNAVMSPKNINRSSKLQFDEKIVENLKIRVLPVISADIAKTMVAILIAILMKLSKISLKTGVRCGKVRKTAFGESKFTC